MLRHHLYDIDRIISRTIAYGPVTAIVAAVFGGVVVLLSSALSMFAEGQTIAVAASTLLPSPSSSRCSVGFGVTWTGDSIAPGTTPIRPLPSSPPAFGTRWISRPSRGIWTRPSRTP